MRKVTWLRAVAVAILPSPLATLALRMLGHKIGRRVRIGYSLLLADRICLDDDTYIGHLNLLCCECLLLRRGAWIGRLNILWGPIRLVLRRDAAVGNSNKITRGPLGSVTVGVAQLKLGHWSKLTANHRVDCTRSVLVGDYSTIAGVGSQIWTHGYVHDLAGPGQYRIDGRVLIRNNVYIGSGAIINAGVTIGEAAIVGSGTVVANDLPGAGLYVSAAMRHLPRPVAPQERTDLVRVAPVSSGDVIYRKRRVRSDE
jgi:acetyltransferase-like isoleucine patch superfamily enzyme